MTPDTILRWHRQLIAAKCSYAQKTVGRPGLMQDNRLLVVRMARENAARMSNWNPVRSMRAASSADMQSLRVARLNAMGEAVGAL